MDKFGDPAVVFTPASLQRDGVLLEVVQHVGDSGEEEMLHTTACGVQHNAKVLKEEERER